MNKRTLIKKILQKLTADLEGFARAARNAHAEATHEQSRAENKYDTRGLEAAYLARGQSRQAQETEAAFAAFEKLEARAFADGEGIDVGAVVELEHKGEHEFYFIGPKAGGTEVKHEGREIFVITPQSPLGTQLQGRKKGDRVTLAMTGGGITCRIVAVE
jgi:transcription elongation GreA/GreB family factor